MNDDLEGAARLRGIAAGFQQARVLLLGVELGLFDRLDREPARARELADDLDATLRGVEITADALVAMGLLGKVDGRYANTEEASAFLVTGKPGSLAHILRHNARTFRSWALLDTTVREGLKRRERDKGVLSETKANREFILGMAEVSRGRVGPVLERLPLEGAERFVDLGGGPAHYACEAVRRHPRLRATLVDLPLTAAVAGEYIARQGLSDRVDAVVCDFYEAETLELGGPVGTSDVVLISQVLHAEGEAENRGLLRRLAEHVAPGGRVFVSENMVGPDRTSPLPGALFAVNMLAGTVRGRTYTASEVAEWLDAAGFEPGEPVDVSERTTLIGGQRR